MTQVSAAAAHANHAAGNEETRVKRKVKSVSLKRKVKSVRLKRKVLRGSYLALENGRGWYY